MSFLWNRRTLKRIQPPGGKFSDADQEWEGVFNDDYVHKNLLTLNYAGKGLNFVVKGKATLDLKGSSLNKPEPKTSSSVKIVTQVSDSAVETKFDNKGTVRVWGDLGTYDVGFPLTVSGKVKTTSAFEKVSYAAVLQGRHGDVQTNNRIHVKANGHSFLNSKILFQRGDVSVGAITKLSLATFLLSKLTLLGSYRLGSQTLFASLANRGNGLKSELTSQNLTLAALWEARKNRYAVQVGYNLLDKVDPLSVSVGAVTKVNDQTTLRAKVDNKAVLAVSTKYVHTSNLTVQLGTQVTLNNPKTFTTNSLVPVPLGLSLNFAYA